MATRIPPAAAWAGLVLLGNGDLRPFAGGQPPTYRWRRLASMLGISGVLLVAALALAHRRARRHGLERGSRRFSVHL